MASTPSDARDPRGEQTSAHWEKVYAEQGPEVVLSAGVPNHVIDVGAGASTLPDALLEAGVGHVTLLDLSMSALALTAVRLEGHGNRATTIVADVLTHAFDEQYDVWHDRAVFHFLVEPQQRAAYTSQVRGALRPGGLLVIGTFAPDGPDSCSGLPVARYDADALAAELGEGFTLLGSRRAEHHTPRDSVQPFTWVVLGRD
jgi:SAM-dependent methyltransferase